MNGETIDIVDQVERDNVKFISLQFTDLFGTIKEIQIPSIKLKDALNYGVWFDGSSIEGFARIQESDMFLKPDPRTYAVIPWVSESKRTARFICDIYRPDGMRFEGDPRFILQQVVKEANEMGFQYYVGPEPEFYIFREGTNPIDPGSYFDLSSDDGYKLMKEITIALMSFGIDVEASHHEVGPGQYEIDFKYGHCVEIADKLVTLKYVVKRISQKLNFHASFMPKPIMNLPGSGMHTHQSLVDINTNKNVFYNKDDPYQLSNLAYNFIAGQMNHIKAMCSILCPLVNSYKRLVSGFEAPVYIMWARLNRSALIRVPKWFEDKPETARIELRCPDPGCNPYLGFAVMLKAGIDGIKNGLIPPTPVEENVYRFDYETLSHRKIDVLPTSLYEALNELKKDKIIQEALGEHLYTRYIEIKTREWDEFKTQVTPWEINKYIDI